MNSCSESYQEKFSVKILEKHLWRRSFLVKLHNHVPWSFYLREKPAKNKKAPSWMFLLKLQVLFITCTSSKFIVTHFEGIAIFDVVFAQINETLCLLSNVTLSKNLEFLCNYMFATNPKILISIYVLEKREWISFCPHQNVHLPYYLQNNQPKLKNLYLDVPLFFLYSYVEKPDKYHQQIIKTHYLQLVACRWYKLKRAMDPKLNLVVHRMLLMVYLILHFP